MIRKLFCTGLAAAGFTACQTTAEQPPKDAILINPGPAEFLEISETVSKALGRGKTILSKDALTQKSELIIDPKYVNDRSLQRPDHFRLQISGSECRLLHEESGEIYPLSIARCKPLLP